MVGLREQSASPWTSGSLQSNDCDDLQRAFDSDALVGAIGGPVIAPGFSTDLTNVLEFKIACKRAVEDLIGFLDGIELPAVGPDISVHDLRIPTVEEQVEEALKRELEQRLLSEPPDSRAVSTTIHEPPPPADEELVGGPSSSPVNDLRNDQCLSGGCDEAGLRGNREREQDGPEQSSTLRRNPAGDPLETPSGPGSPPSFNDDRQQLNSCCQDDGPGMNGAVGAEQPEQRNSAASSVHAHRLPSTMEEDSGPVACATDNRTCPPASQSGPGALGIRTALGPQEGPGTTFPPGTGTAAVLEGSNHDNHARTESNGTPALLPGAKDSVGNDLQGKKLSCLQTQLDCGPNETGNTCEQSSECPTRVDAHRVDGLRRSSPAHEQPVDCLPPPEMTRSGPNGQGNGGITSVSLSSAPQPQPQLPPPATANEDADAQMGHAQGEGGLGGEMSDYDNGDAAAAKNASGNGRRGKGRQRMSKPAQMQGQKRQQRRKGVVLAEESSAGAQVLEREQERPPATGGRRKKRKPASDDEDTEQPSQKRAKTDRQSQKNRDRLPEHLKHMISHVVSGDGGSADAMLRQAMVTRIREKRDAMKSASNLRCLTDSKERAPPALKVCARGNHREAEGRGKAVAEDDGADNSSEPGDAPMPGEELRDDVSAGEVVLRVALYHHEKRNIKAQEFQVLGSQYLTQLRDRFCCTSDKIAKDHDIDAPSGFICIENTFYSDLRRADAIDYSEDIMRRLLSYQEKKGNRKASEGPRRGSKQVSRAGAGETAGEGNSRQPKSSNARRRASKQPCQSGEAGEGCSKWPKSCPYGSSRMECTRFEDLRIRLGFPYVYCHQGSCYHRIQFSDLRLIHDMDVHNTAKYPVLQFQPRLRKRKCTICEVYHASRVTYADKLAPTTPCLFCDQCFFLLHYDEDGVLVYDDFQAYPVYND